MITSERIPFHSLVNERELRPTIILLSSTLLLAVHRAFGSIDFACASFGIDRSLPAALYMFGTAFLLMGVVPFLLVRFVFEEDLRNYGVCLGDYKAGSLMVLALFPVIALLLLLPATHTQEMREFYPFAREALGSTTVLLRMEAARVLFFYLAWEFLFRGFMLFGLRRYVGDWVAICIQTIPSCLWHIGMPTGELLGSFAGGVLFGVMAIRTRSILWPLLLHAGIGIAFDVLLYIQQ